MKKLNLNRETVRNLTSSDLSSVAGGKPPTPCKDTIPTEWPTCDGDTCVTCDTCPGTTCGPECTTDAKVCLCNLTETDPWR